MNDWDDLRFFLAVADVGSIRGAATVLGVNHSTVSRRIDGFEARLGTRLFERLPSGYFVTKAGEEISLSARSIQAEFDAIDRRIIGRDARLGGLLRVTLPDTLALKLLMPDLVAFSRQHPAIEIELITSNSMANLSKREADVAIRISNDPPEHLVGRRLLRYANAVYASPDYLRAHDFARSQDDLVWIGWGGPKSDRVWVRDSDYPRAEVRNRLNNPLIQIEAAKAGLGMAMLPCLMGDQEPALRRVPPGNTVPSRDIWILTHEDLRNTARVRLFSDFMARAILARKDLIEGKRPFVPARATSDQPDK